MPGSLIHWPPSLNAFRLFSQILLLVVCANAGSLKAQNYGTPGAFPLIALQDEIRWLSEEQYVSTATKTREKVSKSGSSVSILTQEDLKRMGARNLMDALKRLPGFSIQKTNIGIYALEVRGVMTGDSEKILVMVNGHSINNNLANGGAIWAHGDINIDNIKRVEIIRGPGSALHGTDAFVAIINIITLTQEDLDGTELTLGLESDAGKTLNIQTAKQIGELKFAANAHIHESNGLYQFVEQDADNNSGYTLDWKNRYDLTLNASYADFHLNAKYLIRQNGPFIGIANRLNNKTEQEYIEYFIDLGYQKRLSNALEMNANVYFDQFEANNFWELLPENHPGFGNGAFPDGLLGSPTMKNQKIGMDLHFDFQLNKQHKFLSGIHFEHQTLFDVKHLTNFNPNDFSPLPNFTDNSAQWNWNGSHNRDIFAVYLQNIWDINNTIRMINGVRVDRYSDFGTSINPRSSLTWEFIDDFNLALSYGTAFRAPNFANLYNINNPAITGNPELEPEEIETFEISINGQVNRRTSFKVTSFKHHIKDIIESKPMGQVSVYQNSSKLNVDGLELELSTRLRNGSTIDFNYTYQQSKDKQINKVSSNIPQHKANFAYNYRHSKQLGAFAALNYRSKLNRPDNDTRPTIDARITTDVALNWRNKSESIELIASIYNLFNDQAHDPSNVIKSDIPTEDRHIAIKLIHKL